MNFETKFNLDDHAWCMKDNKPTEVIISAIEIFFVNTNQDQMKYNAKNVPHSISWLDHTNLFESMLFKSKDELLKSLFADEKVGCKGKNCSSVNGRNHSNECIEEHERCVAGKGHIT